MKEQLADSFDVQLDELVPVDLGTVGPVDDSDLESLTLGVPGSNNDSNSVCPW